MAKAKKVVLTGTPDVVEFKGRRLYVYLKTLSDLSGSQDSTEGNLTDSYLTECLHLLSRISTEFHCSGPKSYRYQLQHNLKLPEPQYFCLGFKYDSRAWDSVEDRQNLNIAIRAISDAVSSAVRGDFSSGLKNFLVELRNLLGKLESIWEPVELLYLHKVKSDDDNLLGSLQSLVDCCKRICVCTNDEAVNRLLIQAILRFSSDALHRNSEIPIEEDILNLCLRIMAFPDRAGIGNVEFAETFMKKLKRLVSEALIIRVIPDLLMDNRITRLTLDLMKHAENRMDVIQSAKQLPRIM
jgi:hypothetical protein